MTEGLGRWDPVSPNAALALLGEAGFRWYVAGGHALELALGRSWRDHDDLDVGVSRTDLDRLHDHLAGWDLHVASGGRLTPWDGRALAEARAENNVWARPTPHDPWAIDVVVSGGDEEAWWSRREPMMRLPWTQALGTSAGGVPFLVPEATLLMKSKQPRPKDDLDARVVIPELGPERRVWLAERLPPDHGWRELLARGRSS